MMRYARDLQRRHGSILCAVAITMLFLCPSYCAAQAAPASPPPDASLPQDLKKYPGLLPEIGRLWEKLQHNLQYPAARSESRLLPLLPESTLTYLSISNFGDAVHQVVKIFEQELKESPVLLDWWQHGELAKGGPKVEEALEKVYQLSQYLGDEIVVSGGKEGQDFKLLMVAEVRKPGLKEHLQLRLKELGKSATVRVLDAQELATAEGGRPAQELVLLVRPDFVAGALDVDTLRSFSARVDRKSREFLSVLFGQRLVQAYEGGVTFVGGADLHGILSQIPTGSKQSQMIFQQSGFADMKYLVWRHKSESGATASETELSFTGPRHGVASWLRAPARIGGLDFVSPKAVVAMAVALKDPAQIYEDIRALATASDPHAFAAVDQGEQALHLSLKEDLLNLLGGEITMELDDFTPPRPAWRGMLRVSDANNLQQTLSTLLAAANLAAVQSEEGGVTYHTVRIPTGRTPYEVVYAYVDGYLILASSRESVAEAIRVHGSGESLGKSKDFLASLPPGHPAGVSGLFYEDAVALSALMMRQAPPELAAALAQAGGIKPVPGGIKSVMVCAYGEESAIREESSIAAMDAGVVLIVAAIAIPNLLRSRIAANEASAVGSIRTVNTAQVVYGSTYQGRGYARDLASLGPDPRGGSAPSADHADLIDSLLGDSSCTAGAWCTKSGYQFSVQAVCKQQRCGDYVVVATPVTSNTTGVRNFCSTSDGVIRYQTGPPLSAPLTISECRAWTPIQ